MRFLIVAFRTVTVELLGVLLVLWLLFGTTAWTLLDDPQALLPISALAWPSWQSSDDQRDPLPRITGLVFSDDQPLALQNSGS